MKKVFLPVIQHIAIALTVALFLVSFMPGSASAQSISDYFSFSYDVQFSESLVTGSESFEVTVTAQVTCIQDLPVSASEASITGRIVAENQSTGTRVTLRSSYSLTIDPFPSNAGETGQQQVVVPLQFPQGSASGTYNVIAELIEAKVRAIIWIPVTGYLPSSQAVGSITYTAGGGAVGGGGGGGSPAATKVSFNGLRTNKDLMVNSSGVVQDSTRLWCLEANAYLDIAQGTKLLNARRDALTSLTARPVDSPPAPAPGTAIVAAVDFGPDGTTFIPAITLVMDYGSLDEGMAEEELYIAYRDGSQWRALPSVLDIGINRVSAQVNHFTQFAIVGTIAADETSGEAPPPPPVAEPPEFTISTLTITPAEVTVARLVIVSATVTNSGGSRGKYAVTLKVNGVEEAEKQLVLDAGVEYTVSFEITRDPIGRYEVDINGLIAYFTVREEAPETAEMAETAETSPKIPPEIAPPPLFNWWLISGTITGIVLLGGILTFWLIRRRY